METKVNDLDSICECERWQYFSGQFRIPAFDRQLLAWGGAFSTLSPPLFSTWCPIIINASIVQLMRVIVRFVAVYHRVCNLFIPGESTRKSTGVFTNRMKKQFHFGAHNSRSSCSKYSAVSPTMRRMFSFFSICLSIRKDAPIWKHDFPRDRTDSRYNDHIKTSFDFLALCSSTCF